MPNQHLIFYLNYQFPKLLPLFNSYIRALHQFLTSTTASPKFLTYHYDKVCNFNNNLAFTTTSYDVSHTLMKNYYTTADTTPYHYVPLHKQYELTNHLGNVLATISARPRLIYDNSNPPVFKYKDADITSVSDYYPFGMLAPERHWQYDSYRFGFNAQEADDEITGERTHYTATGWEYDSTRSPKT